MSEEKKQSRLITILTKEYKHEGLILLFLALVAVVLGTLIITNKWTFQGIFLLEDYPKAFAWILIGLGTFSVILAVWPFYKPSIEEVKRVSWPSRGILLKNTLIVLLFSLTMSIFFASSDAAIRAFLDFLYSIR